jgi:hypothetical protein
MSDKLREVIRGLRDLEEVFRLHPDPDVNVWAGEIRQLRHLLEKATEEGMRPCWKDVGPAVALARLLWDLVEDIGRNKD